MPRTLTGRHGGGEPVTSQTQRQVTAALAGMAHIVFIADRGSVIEARNGCEQVKGGGILITLGLLGRSRRELRVGINGYVACLGATWLTYVLQEQPGGGWRVTGTTGFMGVYRLTCGMVARAPAAPVPGQCREAIAHQSYSGQEEHDHAENAVVQP